MFHTCKSVHLKVITYVQAHLSLLKAEIVPCNRQDVTSDVPSAF